MQIWFIESKFLGLLRVSYDESALGLDLHSKQIEGAIISIDMMSRQNSITNNSTESKEFVRCLKNYEKGDFQAFDALSVEISGTDFQSNVLRQMRLIKPGTVVTYGDLASLSGKPKAARAVATACSTNKVPLVLPCHRVVPSDLSIGNYASRKMTNGSKLKENLLLHEDALL